MHVSHLALADYRSYRDVVVEFPPGPIVLQGGNGRGKTNLVEALSYLSDFSSHRGGTPTSLVRVGDEGEDPPGGAVVRLRVARGGRSSLLELEIARGRANRGRLNQAQVQPRELLGVLRSVVFAPEDLLLLRGDPSGRRRFIDEVITQLKPHYLGVRQDLDRVLRQRAAVLKDLGRRRSAGDDQLAVLDVWDEQLAALSAEVAEHRAATLAALAPLVQEIYGLITQDDRVAQVEYLEGGKETSPENGPERGGSATGLRVEDGHIRGDATERLQERKAQYLAEIERRRQEEMRRGINLVGAHRDDMRVSLDGLPVRGYASHGELWSSALALRLAQLQLLTTEGERPVLVLDDVFAELDASRRAGLLQLIEDVDQVFITAAVARDLPEGLAATHFRVYRGQDGLSRVEPMETPTPVLEDLPDQAVADDE